MKFFDNILIYVLISILMVIIAYYPLRLRRFFKVLGYFYLITFLAAGVLMLGYNLNLNSPFAKLTANFNLSLKDTWIFLLGILVLWLLGKFSWRVFQGRICEKDLLVSVIIKFGEKKEELKALVDTGNQLKDPLTEMPVIIVELDSLLKVLPPHIKKAFTNYNLELEIEELATILGESSWANRFRLIPFSAVGAENGLLIGLKPDKVIVDLHGDKMVIDRVIIGIYDQQFEQGREYTALVNPELLDVIVEGY
jgi:stage II sporulation protein GA (sporulation sigma-E factor processing peptidase)